MNVIVVDGDLLDQNVDVIVNAWNRNIFPWWLLIPQGVSGAIKRRGGLEPFRELRRFGPIPLGHAVETSAGKLPFKSIIHVAGINLLWRSSERSIRDSVRNAISIAQNRGYKSLALPLIGARSGGGKPARVQSIIKDELRRCQFDGDVLLVRHSESTTYLCYPDGGCNTSRCMQMDSELFIACALAGNGKRNWTLTTRLGDMLSDAEQQFGPRDLSYTMLGIEFCGTRPMIRYYGDGKQIVIQLSVDCLTDLPQACYQLGHECIHLLAPTGKRDATNLEEGLATLFGENYATMWFDAPRNCGAKNYEFAKGVTLKALSSNPAFVREIRESKPSFNDFTPQDIVGGTGITLADAEYLCSPFAWD